jgi:hypothetical protein
MTMHFPDLNDDVRAMMLEEIRLDQEQSGLYMSNRLSPTGREAWLRLLAHAAESGTPQSLASELRKNGCLLTSEMSQRNGKPYTKAVPRDAPDTLAEGEFNRFYIRAICVIALHRGQAGVEVYRAKDAINPRPESVSKVGSRVDADSLLNDLRTNPGIESALGIPAGPNSGLSVRLVPATAPILAT